MKKTILITLLLSASFGLSAQSLQARSIDEVLQSILQNNKELQANAAQVEAQTLQARSENNLPDPEVQYVHQWGNKEGMGFTGELEATQSFAFPTLYAQRSKLIEAQRSSYEALAAVTRQQILLQAKQTCLDLVYLHQMRSLLSQRLQNAELLNRFYASQLEKGATTAIETGKVELEMLNARNEMRQNETAIREKNELLQALNGGVAIAFADSVYPQTTPLPSDFEAFRLEAFNELPEMNYLQENQSAAARQINVSKQQGLPNITLGYRMNPASGGERYNGLLVGLSIPIFSNRHKVKQAKAERLSAELQLAGWRETQTAELRQLWSKASELKRSVDEYSEALKGQNSLSLLNKAIQSGQISMIDYFVNVGTIYQSTENWLQLQNEYQKSLAEMYRYKL